MKFREHWERIEERFHHGPHGRISIKWGLFSGFAIFAAVILVLLWVFQTMFLNDFYRFIKIREIKDTAQTIEKGINSDDLGMQLSKLSQNNQICIIVSDEYGDLFYSEDASPSCVIHRLNPLQRAAIYMLTDRNGGTYFETFFSDNLKTAPDLQRRTYRGEDPDAPENMIYTFIAERENGRKLLVLLNSTISPVGATVQTLRIQLMWITVIMLGLAIALALFMSRRISGPIIQINSSAKGLAHGDYNVEFLERGYREIAELGITLNYAAKELSKVETLRRDLIANVSHDLRTPLTMITGYSEVMRDLPGENTPENVQVIIDEANRLTTLVNDMLDLSKMQSGTQTLSRSVYDLTESIRNILKRYNKLTDYNINFTAGRNVEVYADELKISQVVYNLVNNALTYTGADKCVYVRQLELGGKVRIEVRDTGEGIAQDKLKDIWERYYKVDKAHKRAQVGTGLGLSIVRTILDMHGGAYGVQSEEGVGSTFWFELDMEKEPEI
ncbi:HAMP domain-containing sensor histidine kinase [Clostridium sp. D33t1_170424_F3]|uniref:sensor histidine kinase n=1 Tax=Clostridium sp. D33t1_170424_F3 TaxID=2787099 RepID=UPI002570F982|nr:HAMP domain-containing sensor histidine kinase [Clostridium sp. D33t1_170424_F3]